MSDEIKLYFCNYCGSVIAGIVQVPYNNSTTNSRHCEGHVFIKREHKQCLACGNKHFIELPINQPKEK